MNCYDMIYGNDYYDLIVRNTAYLPPLSDGICGLDVGNNYTILLSRAIATRLSGGKLPL